MSHAAVCLISRMTVVLLHLFNQLRHFVKSTQRDKPSPLNLTRYAVLPHNRDRIVTTTDISRTFCQRATKFGNVGGLANRKLVPKFRELCSGGPVMPCGDMHQSFTASTCKVPFDNFPMFDELLVFFLFTALREN